MWGNEVFDALPTAVCIADEHAKVLAENAPWRRMDPIRVGASLVAPCDDHGEACPLAHAVRAVLRGDRGEIAVEYVRGREDDRRWIRARVTRLDAPGPGRVMIVQEDVTARKREQMDLTRTMQLDRMVAVGSLAAGLGHEINNPLAYVMANLEFLAEELEARLPRAEFEAFREVLSEMRHGTERIHRIARDVLTFADLKQDVVQRVAVQDVIDSTLSLVSNALRHRARLVKVDGPTLHVNGSPSRLGQVFYNLLLNAVQAIPEGAAKDNEIAVTTSAEGSNVVVEIRDTGCGIPREHIRRVFDPFFTTREVGQGTGLGLAISRSIVHQLGGDIEVHSVEGSGTTMRVVLPMAERQATSTLAPMTKPSGRARVLLVDDEPAFGSAVRRMLSSSHDVTVVTTGQEALAKITDGPPYDVILCDLMMPGMTGMDLHASLTAEHPEMARRMVFLTGGAFTQRARDFLRELDGPVVDKPCDSRRLNATIAEVLRQAQSRAKLP